MRASAKPSGKRPAFQFYPADWRKDPELGSCKYVARGIWWEMLCVMHECRPYGHLARNGVPIPDQSVAELIKVPLAVYAKAVQELEVNGVFSRLADGTIYSRRMVRDEHLRQVRATSGKQGGNPLLVKQTAPVQPDLLNQTEPVCLTKSSDLLNHVSNQNPTPSARVCAPAASAVASAVASARSLNPGWEVESQRGDGADESNDHPGADSPQVEGQNWKRTASTWRNPAWVAATAKTLGIDRRTGESDAEFTDRVRTAVDAKKRADQAEAKIRQAGAAA